MGTEQGASGERSADAAASGRIDLARTPDFQLGKLRARPSLREVWLDGTREQLEPRVMQVLATLARRAGQVVSRDELVDCCWEGRIVGDDSINRVISKLRRLSEQDGGASFSIETIARVGYRLWTPELASEPVGETGSPAAATWAATSSIEPRPGQSVAGRRRGPLAWALAAGLAVLLAVAGWQFRDRLGGGGESRLSLAVLPFTDLSPGGGQAYFAEGVAEEIQGRLTGRPEFTVIGRTSARHFKDETDYGAIRRALNVSHVLEGSIQRAGPTVRFNVRLIRAADGEQLWAREYDRPAADVFAVQDEIGSLVVEELGGALSNRAGPARPTPGVEAYDLVLAARARLRERRPADIAAAKALLLRAVEVNPDYGPAWGELANATLLSSDAVVVGYGRTPASEAQAQARAYAQRAVALASDRPEGHAALATLAATPQAAATHLRAAVRLDPSNADLRVGLAQQLVAGRDYSGALAQLREATMVDPLHPRAHLMLAVTLADMGRDLEATAAVARFEALHRRPAEAALTRALLAGRRGDWSEAVRLAELAHSDPGGYRRPHAVGPVYRILGLTDRAAALKSIASRPFEVSVYARDDRAALAQIDAAGETLWDDPGRSWMAADVLIRTGRAGRLLAVFDSRYPGAAAYCQTGVLGAALYYADALARAGRAREAATVLDCAERRARSDFEEGWWRPLNSFTLARIAALRGDRGQALIRLEAAYRAGFRGHFHTADPIDYPEFRAIAAEPRFQRTREALLRHVAQERAKVLSNSRASSPETPKTPQLNSKYNQTATSNPGRDNGRRQVAARLGA